MLKQLIEKFNKTGYIAYHYPRLKKVRINGGRMYSEKEAVKILTDILSRYTHNV